MAVVSADLLEENSQEELVEGGIQIDITRVYLVQTDDATDGPTTVMASVLLPQLGSTAVPAAYPLITVYVIRRGYAFRPENVQSKKLWHVPIFYTNRTSGFDRNTDLPPDPLTGEPIQDPTLTPQTVELSFRSEYKIPSDAQFGGVFRQNGPDTFTQAPNPPWFNGRFDTPQTTSREVLANAKKRYSLPVIRVSRVVKTWNPLWDGLIDHVNDNTLTVTQQDADGVRFNKTFEKRQLLLTDIAKQDLWIQQKLYFRVTFTFDVDDRQAGHTFDSPDTVSRRFIFENQYRNRATEAISQYSQADLNKHPSQFLPLVTTWQLLNQGGGSVPSNGYGQPYEYDTPDIDHTLDADPYIIRWLIEPEANFSIFGIK